MDDEAYLADMDGGGQYRAVDPILVSGFRVEKYVKEGGVIKQIRVVDSPLQSLHCGGHHHVNCKTCIEKYISLFFINASVKLFIGSIPPKKWVAMLLHTFLRSIIMRKQIVLVLDFCLED